MSSSSKAIIGEVGVPARMDKWEGLPPRGNWSCDETVSLAGGDGKISFYSEESYEVEGGNREQTRVLTVPGAYISFLQEITVPSGRFLKERMSLRSNKGLKEPINLKNPEQSIPIKDFVYFLVSREKLFESLLRIFSDEKILPLMSVMLSVVWEDQVEQKDLKGVKPYLDFILKATEGMLKICNAQQKAWDEILAPRERAELSWEGNAPTVAVLQLLERILTDKTRSASSDSVSSSSSSSSAESSSLSVRLAEVEKDKVIVHLSKLILECPDILKRAAEMRRADPHVFDPLLWLWKNFNVLAQEMRSNQHVEKYEGEFNRLDNYQAKQKLIWLLNAYANPEGFQITSRTYKKEVNEVLQELREPNMTVETALQSLSNKIASSGKHFKLDGDLAAALYVVHEKVLPLAANEPSAKPSSSEDKPLPKADHFSAASSSAR